ncbi:Zinc finger protein 74-like [Homarus americanus]|uniref:Zinc finger protein 74-like n=1 Tax=Homarus americanus TaxID=6706 RepID=A0A8J5JU48_HOMAM|nr:Zinc finger protein 74-like [Homarus americanus]
MRKFYAELYMKKIQRMNGIILHHSSCKYNFNKLATEPYLSGGGGPVPAEQREPPTEQDSTENQELQAWYTHADVGNKIAAELGVKVADDMRTLGKYYKTPRTIARDEYILPQGVLPDTLGRGAVEREAAMTNCNLTAITHVIQKRPFQSPLEVRDVKKPRSKALQFICCMPECAEKFNSREHLETHMKLHLGVKPFTCDVCGKVCQTESKLKTHQASHANDGFKPKCDICERSFSSRSALNKHKKMLHKPKPHVCLHCNSGFEERKYMVIHAKRAHDVDLPLEVKELQPPTSAVNFETLSAPPNQSFDPPKEHSQSDSTMLQKKTDISENTDVSISRTGFQVYCSYGAAQVPCSSRLSDSTAQLAQCLDSVKAGLDYPRCWYRGISNALDPISLTITSLRRLVYIPYCDLDCLALRWSEPPARLIQG